MAPISPRGLTYGFSLAKVHWLSKFKPQHAFFGGLVSLSKYHHYLRIKKGTCDHVRPVGHLHPHPHPPAPIRGLMNTAAPREQQVELPGFGKPIPDKWSSSEAFPHPLADGRLLESKGVTLRERRMLDFIGSISDKPEWDRKVFDEAVIAKWRGEAMSRPTVEDNDVYMSESMFENCIKELQDKALRFRETGFIHALDTELTVVKSDTAVSQEMAEALRVNSRRLEDVAESAKDWHPRSDNLVLDLLHPSLFPVVFGTTRALPTGQVTLHNCFDCIGAGELTSAMAVEDPEWGSYQWLPSDIRFTPSGPKLTSYVNNLHPHAHRSLYPVLEAFVAAAIPLWEESLSWFDDRRRLKIEATDDSEFSLPEGVKYDIPPRASAGAFADDVSDEDWLEEYHKETDEYQEWWRENRVLAFPEPDPFVPFAKQVDLAKRVSLRQQFPDGIQVIFKLANIHLTPEKPEYGGGSWHIEGGLTERVCASALYYYDEDNITPSRLAFRQKADVEHLIDIPSLQDKYHSLEAYLGIKQEDSAIQELGSVLTRQGRMLVFPNALQHQVQPFRLQDASRPGHRKILAMFLIEPGRRILSTSNVPPQRKDWWEPQVRKIPAFAALPQEIFDLIMGHFDYPLSWEAALEIREKLMDERSRITKEVNDTLHKEYFAFCEH